MNKIPFLNFQPMHNQIRSEMHQAFTEVYDSNWSHLEHGDISKTTQPMLYLSFG